MQLNTRQVVTMNPKFLLLISLIFLTSCSLKFGSNSEDISQTDLNVGLGKMNVNINKYSANKLVCDPFGGGGSISYEQGIKATLHYRTSTMPRMYKSTDYVNFAYKSPQTIFMSDMNVPTRMFTEGFTVANGRTLMNDDDQKLIEYFALKMNTNVVLSENDEEGWYEFALLSDDGTQMSIKSGTDAEATLLINNDGDHPTRMGCSNQSMYLRKGVMLPIEVTYYQGPRYHISNVLMFRKAEVAGKDPSCGLTGNNTFFDPNNHSVPLKPYNDLLTRGWKVLGASNFMVSQNQSDYNPCVKGTNPVISNFVLNDMMVTSAYFNWNTDIPATSQLQFTNTATQETVVTTSDNVLRVNHTVQITGLKSGASYKVQAISISADLGRSLSPELTITVP